MTSSKENFDIDTDSLVFFFSPAPEVKFSGAPEQVPASASSSRVSAPSPVDESQPITSIQIRLADGTRYVNWRSRELVCFL